MTMRLHSPLPFLLSRGVVWPVLALVCLGVSCSDPPEPSDVSPEPPEVACQSNSDCDGRICLLEICRDCIDDEACEEQEEYGVGATCGDEGVCVSCKGQLDCACEGGACDDGLLCVDEACAECSRGSEGCPCFPNNTCDEGFRCAEGSCEVCPPGEEGCTCDGEVCGEGLVCQEDVCVGCPPGDEGCACSDGGLCGDGLRCVQDQCEACPPGEAGCACDGDVCVEGLVCQAEVCVQDDCVIGALDCPCFENETCDEGLRCANNICALCPPGEEGCACDGEVCGEGLVCQEDVCVQDGCVVGSLDCPCGDEDEEARCDEGLTCTEGGLCAECTSDIVDCPCVDDECGGDLLCNDDDVCVECTSDTEGCPCDEDDACQDGLVCDGEETACRAPLACVELGCGLNQLCLDFEPGIDASCLEECEEGFEFNGEAQTCDEIVEIFPNCGDGQEGSILEMCRSLDRDCVADGENQTAECGDCLDFFLEEAQLCRAVRTCEDLGCVDLNRDCTANDTDTDALCGGCRLGFEEIEGVCQPLPQANCELGNPNSILDECTDNNRLCIEEGNTARCGGCLEGFGEDPETQQCIRRLCIDLDPSCEDLGRSCVNEPVAECGGCLPGLIETDENDPLSQCIETITCADRIDNPELACDPEFFCIEREGQDSECAEWPCLGEDDLPDFTQAFREDAPEDRQCVPCELACGGTEENPIEGETGRIWPFTLENSNRCLCETEPGFYILPEGDFTASPCDSDGDGWVSVSARDALDSGDPALIENARCSLRTIDRVVLDNEFRQSLTVKICDEGLVAQTACDSLECDERGLNCADCGGGRCDPQTSLCDCVLTRTVDLYESVRNDEQLRLGAEGENDAPTYALGGRGRRLVAAELNPMTKACISVTGDYNDNGVRDIVEWHGDEPSEDADTNFFLQFSHFVELYEGRFERTPGQPIGRYNIREKSRCDPGFPVAYDPALDESEYWRACSRNRDADYDSTGDNVLIGHDFAAWSCPEQSETCPVPPPPTSLTPNGTIPAHGLCDPEVTLPPIDGVWRGMNHMSQFKCVNIVEEIPDPDDRLTFAPHELALDTGELAPELAGADAQGAYQINRCGIACPLTQSVYSRPLSNFADVSDMTLNGDAEQVGDELVLTDDAGGVGSAFLTEPLTLTPGTSFSTHFMVHLDANDAGFSFALQNDARGPAALGGAFGDLGIVGVNPSVVIEFDVSRNQDRGDLDQNHIALNVNNDLNAPLAYAQPPFAMGNGTGAPPFFVWIDYDGPTDSMSLFVSREQTRPETPLWTASVALDEVLGERAFIGFTASICCVPFNRHVVQSWSLVVEDADEESADLDCTQDCSGGACAQSSIGRAGQSDLPVVVCEPVGREDLQVGDVGFAAVRYIEPEGGLYERGCLDEFRPDPSIEASEPWQRLCPGFEQNPVAIVGQGNPESFGALICGCNTNYGGVNCDIACPFGQPYFGGTCEGVGDNGYCPVDPETEGRNGFWMCGTWSSVSFDDPQRPFFDAPEGWKMTGEVPKDGIERAPFCQNEDCQTGFKLQ